MRIVRIERGDPTLAGSGSFSSSGLHCGRQSELWQLRGRGELRGQRSATGSDGDVLTGHNPPANGCQQTITVTLQTAASGSSQTAEFCVPECNDAENLTGGKEKLPSVFFRRPGRHSTSCSRTQDDKFLR